MRQQEPNLEAIGDRVAGLLCAGASWIRRRNMQLKYLDDVAMRVRLRVECSIPDAIERTGTLDGRDAVHIPLFVLRKAPVPLLDLDFADSAGTRVSFPTRRSRKDVAEATLLAQARRVLQDELGSPFVSHDVAEWIATAARASPPSSVDACDALLQREPTELGIAPRATLADNEDFRFLAQLVAWSWLIVTPVPFDRRESVYTLSYTDPIDEWTSAWGAQIRTGLEPLPAYVDLPFVGAQSFHLEVHPPRGMTMGPGTLAAHASGRRSPKTEAQATGRTLHLRLEDAEDCRSGLALLSLCMRRDGLIDGARVACALVAAMLVLSFVVAGRLAQSNNTGPTLLLAVPGLLASYTLRPAEHALTHRVLRGTRWLLYVCAMAAYLAAFWLVVAPNGPSSFEPFPDRSPAIAVCAAVPEPALHVAQLSSGACPHGALVVTPPPAIVVGSTDPPARPSVLWLRVVWGVLAIFALFATFIANQARRQAEP